MAESGERREAAEVVLLDEVGRWFARQSVAPLVHMSVRVGDRDEAGDGLLLEPSADVALNGAGGGGELARRGEARGHLVPMPMCTGFAMTARPFAPVRSRSMPSRTWRSVACCSSERSSTTISAIGFP